jgi:alpha-L-fucosidase
MKRLILPLTILTLSAAAQTLPKPLPAPPSQDAKMKWFRDAKFGLFIHWGLYAIPAGEWKGQPIAGIGEWIMNRAKIPVTEYEQLASSSTPSNSMPKSGSRWRKTPA